jgi:hypothetical protein
MASRTEESSHEKGDSPDLARPPRRALKQHGVGTLYTRDGDFRKFPFLDVRDPFAK